MNKYRNYLVLFMVGSLFSINSCSVKKIKEITFDEHAYIDLFNSFNPKWQKAVQENDPSYIISRYDTDAIIGAPDKRFVIGKAAITNYWQNLVVFLDDFAYETEHIGGNPNDVLYENGRAFVTYTINNQQITDTTKYLFVWKYIGNNEYRVLSEMFNALE